MRSDARQAQILSCAKKVFAERGFHGSSVGHICREAGIGRGTLYQYFPNKKAVFAALLGQVLARVEAFMVARRRLVAANLRPPEQMRREAIMDWSAQRLRELLEVVFEDEHTLRILLREAVGLDVDVEALLGKIDDRLVSLLAADLEAAQQFGLVRDLNPRLTATLMVGGVEKLLLAAIREAGPIDLDLLAREATRLHSVGVLSPRVPTGGKHGTD